MSSENVSEQRAPLTAFKSFKCPLAECRREFKNAKRLSEHKKRTHSGSDGGKYLCEVCAYRTRFRHNLTEHMRIHIGDKPYCCANCGALFTSLTQLNEHHKIHNKDSRPYACQECGFAFRTSKALYHHSKLHTPDKTYVCELCGNDYAQAAGMSQHRRWHRAQNKSCYPSKLTIEVINYK